MGEAAQLSSIQYSFIHGVTGIVSVSGNVGIEMSLHYIDGLCMEVSSCQKENIIEHLLMSLKDSSSYLYCVAELHMELEPADSTVHGYRESSTCVHGMARHNCLLMHLHTSREMMTRTLYSCSMWQFLVCWLVDCSMAVLAHTQALGHFDCFKHVI